MLSSRFVLSLVVALCFSTLAAADSTPVNMRSFHFSGGANVASAPSGRFTTNAVNAAPAYFGDVKPVQNMFHGYTHGTICLKNGNWGEWHHKTPTPLSAPEPGSLWLFSTGLIGVSGMVHRKLQRS
jgi:PEP-CTERM motif